MEIFPAIDLRSGRVVRLRKGRDDERTEYRDDPAAVLAEWLEQGARRVHVVDLDAAFGEPRQTEVLARLAATGARLQLGGGLRDRDTVASAVGAGFERVVVGSLVVRDPEAFAAIAREFPGRVVPAVEVAGEEVRIAGWTEGAGKSLAEVCAGLRGLPCPAVLVTDVERDGTLVGPNLDLVRQIARDTGIPGLLSGGVRSAEDLRAAAAVPEIAGAIVGRALYEGALDLADALVAAGGAA